MPFFPAEMGDSFFGECFMAHFLRAEDVLWNTFPDR
jgi:hypothetical protein